MTEAQIEALKLLELVDKICANKKIKYSLGSRALINIEYKQGEEYFDPNSINVCMMYEDYQAILQELDKNGNDYNVDVITYYNKDNFNSLSAWVMYKGKNILAPGREKDECYYKTRVILTPIFYAGNTKAAVEVQGGPPQCSRGSH